MTDFFVDQAGMTKLYNQIRGIANDADTGEAYVRKYADISLGDEGLILDLVGPHNHAYAVVHGAMTRIAEITERTGTSVNASQNAYGRTDRAAAERMDALLPGSPDEKALRTELGKARAGPPFIDVADPTVHFRDADWIDEGVALEFDPFSDLLSPSAYIRLAVHQIAGVDPFVWMVGWLSGNWAAYRQAGTAWLHVGESCPDFAVNLTKAAGDTSQVWRGNAAEGCQELMVAVAKAVDGFRATCDVLSENYVKASEAAKQLYEALSGVAGEIVDKALLALAAAAIGTATIETVVGAVAGYAAAAYYAWQVLDLIDKAVTIYGRAKAAVAGVTAVINTVEANDIEAITVPGDGS